MKRYGSEVCPVDVNLSNCQLDQVDFLCDTSKGNNLIKHDLKL